MATEDAVRFLGSNGPGNLPVNKSTTGFPSSSNNFSPEDLELLCCGQRYHGHGNSGGPSRSGSAPPSMEGSRSALHNISHMSRLNDEYGGLVEAAFFLPRDELLAHPAYSTYYFANAKKPPKFPPPISSVENRYLFRYSGVLRDYLKLKSFDDSCKESLFVPRAALPTHREESEDEKFPTIESIDSPEKTSDAVDGQSGPSLQERRKSLVDLIQEDFPRTPSPVYNVHSHTSNHTTKIQAVPGTLNTMNNTTSIETSKPETGAPTFEGHAYTLDTDTGYSIAKVDSIDNPLNLINGESLSGGAGSELDVMEREMNKFRISNDGFKGQHTQQHSQHFFPSVRGSSAQTQIGLSQFIPQATMDPLGHGQLNLPLSAVQPVLQSTPTASTAPLYATASPYGAPYYSNLQTPSLLSSQYGLGGYPVASSIVSPLLPCFPTQHTAIPFPVDNPSNPNLGARAPGVSTSGSVVPGIDTQQFHRAYGQLGFPFQPSYPNQLCVPYFQQHFVESSAAFSQYGVVTSRGGNVFPPTVSFNPQQGSIPPAYVSELRPQAPRFPAFDIINARKGGLSNSNYYWTTPNLGVVMQYPNSPITSPVYQGSTPAGLSFAGRKNEDVRFPFSSSRGASRGWQSNRGREKVEDPKIFSILEELRSNKSRHYKLSDIAGHVVELSTDQHGSRFIQQKLESCSEEEKTLVFKEVQPHASALITDVFGNYVIQKFFEYGSPQQRRELANELVGNILSLSLQMYGCRVIQKALEVIELGQKMQLVEELDGHVMRCVQDQNGNHVIQKCIECLPTEKISFIISAFRGQVATLATHPYGCRVIQRVLEHCTDENQSQCIVDEILKSACALAEDQYGNYVIQHVLDRGRPHERSQIISRLAGQFVQMSQHKFASNVVEKCFQCGNSTEKEHLIEEILEQTEGKDNLLIMMKDQYANYVVQKILDISTGKEHDILLNRIKVHLQAIRKYTYGKHIVSRVEQLCREDEDLSVFHE